MAAASPLDVVRTHYEAIRRHDRAALMATLTEDVDWQVVGPASMPFGGNYRGRGEAQRFFSTVAGACEVLEFAVDRMVADGDTVIVFGHEHFRVRATGRNWNTDWIQVHTVRDGAICRFREYTDTAAIAAAFA
jgi:ketosteroid isomerase-like protein